MKVILASTLAASLAACGQVDRATAQLTGFSRICVDQVTYLQFTSGATVQMDQTGKPVPCK